MKISSRRSKICVFNQKKQFLLHKSVAFLARAVYIIGMKPIIEYTDYRKYMRDFYEERKRTSAFSWKEFSAMAGFSSCSYMKVVCDGKSKLSRVGVERTAQAMGLAGFELEYFRSMVEFCQAESDEKKMAAFEKMRSIAKVHKVRVLEESVFDYYESWKNPVLRELAPLMPGATPGDMAKMCYPQVSAADVQETLRFLSNAGLLVRQADGSYVQAETSVAGSGEATRLAIRTAHREMAGLAANALDLPVSKRNFTGVTMGVSEDSYARIVKELEECRQKIISIASADSHINQVYRLNLQLFPLTHEVEEAHHEKV